MPSDSSRISDRAIDAASRPISYKESENPNINNHSSMQPQSVLGQKGMMKHKMSLQAFNDLCWQMHKANVDIVTDQ